MSKITVEKRILIARGIADFFGISCFNHKLLKEKLEYYHGVKVSERDLREFLNNHTAISAIWINRKKYYTVNIPSKMVIANILKVELKSGFGEQTESTLTVGEGFWNYVLTQTCVDKERFIKHCAYNGIDFTVNEILSGYKETRLERRVTFSLDSINKLLSKTNTF